MVRPGESAPADPRPLSRKEERTALTFEKGPRGTTVRQRYLGDGGAGALGPYLDRLVVTVEHDEVGRILSIDGFSAFEAELDTVDPRLGLQVRNLGLADSARADLDWQQQAWVGRTAIRGVFEHEATLRLGGFAGTQKVPLRWTLSPGEECPGAASSDTTCVRLDFRSPDLDPAALIPAAGPAPGATRAEGKPVRGIALQGSFLIGRSTGLEYEGRFERSAFVLQEAGALVERRQRVTRSLAPQTE